MAEATQAAVMAEFQRLRRDFEQQASRYPEQTLTIHVIDSATDATAPLFKKPNHTITLWQYMGNLVDSDGVDTLPKFELTKYGLSGAQLSALAVLEGADSGLFRRMAYRAGSIVPLDLRDEISGALIGKSIIPEQPGKAIFSVNSDHLAVWLNLVLTCIATLQPDRFRAPTLAVDPFAASILACDFVLRRLLTSPQSSARAATAILADRKFKVALSFPGEKRAFVSEVALGLRDLNVDVFYDAFFEAELARPDLDVLLHRVYHDNSDLIVVFLCDEYESKEWCSLEWRAVRDLIKRRRGASIMPMRFDDAEVPGLFSIDGYIDLRGRVPQDAVNLIRERLNVPQT
jgi:hypothetical protein